MICSLIVDDFIYILALSLFYLILLFAKTMSCSIHKVTTECQHPWIAGNLNVCKSLTQIRI